MSEATIRAQIKSILSGVSGIGEVYDYQRWASTWEKFLDLFKTDADKINGWMITRSATPATVESTTHESRIHQYKIRGVYGLNDEDETEITFQALIESVASAFRAKRTLNATAEDSGPLSVSVVENRMFGGVLCHFCELDLPAEEFEEWS